MLSSKRSCKVAVLGPIPRDSIITRDGVEFQKHGGALYTTAALAALLGEDGQVVPVSHLRREDAEAVRPLLASLAGVDISRVSDHFDRGDIISMDYKDHDRRIERQTGFMPPIAVEDLADVYDSDAFVFVPVTDYEIPLDVVRAVKANSDGLVIFDAHGPTNTVTRHGERHLKFWLDRDLWLPYIDVLKMNLEEAACAWFRSEYEASALEARRDGYDLPLRELPLLADHCLDRGVAALVVTLGADGCVVYFRSESARTCEKFLECVPVDHVIDTTGCGDSFAAGLAFGLLQSGDYVDDGDH